MQFMESSISKRHSFDDERLTEPHFDEEVTLLSARPVVPLPEVQAQAHSGRRLVFALTVVAALIIGALGARVVERIGGGDNQQAAAEAENKTVEQIPDNESQAAAGGMTNTGSYASEPIVNPVLDMEKGDQAAKSVELKEADKRPAARPVVTESARQDSAHSGEPPIEEEEALASEIQPEPEERDMADRRESRRVNRRLKHGKKGRTADEIMRIREIFEGPARP